MIPAPMIHSLAREREDKIREEVRREENLLERRSVLARQPKFHWHSQLAEVVRHIGSHIAALGATRV